MGTYQLFTDATADCNPQMLESLPAVKVIPMQLEIAGGEYTYGPGGTISPAAFYALQRAGH